MEYPEHLQKFVPPNFDLKKYEGAAHLNALEWLNNILARYTLWEGAGVLLADTFSQQLHDVELNIEQGCKRDILTPNNPSDVFAIKANIAAYSRFDLHPVNGLTIDALVFASEHIKVHPVLAKGVKAGESIYEHLFSSTGLVIDRDKENALKQQAADLYNQFSPQKAPKGYLSIDLTADDFVLQREFSSWLKMERERQGVKTTSTKKFFSPSKLRSWHDSRVLQYLDVVQWHNSIGIQATSSIISKIIFPETTDYRDKVGVLNDTTKRYAEEIMSDKTIKILFNQSLNEKNKGSE